MSPADWTSSDYLAPRVILNHPATTNTGEPVTVATDTRDGRRRIHLRSDDRSEVYFELVLYPHDHDVWQLAAGQRRYLSEEDSSKWDVEATETRRAEILGRPGCNMQVWFSDADGRFLRDFNFVSFANDAEPWSLRLVFDPRSRLNREILRRLEVSG